ncbi:phosphoglycolate phosphatase [Liquorilactobacillus aquaticus DSM 21051]|uniref:Phosphoglycolate phosphatase n=1 Tax=Liquorilactobacillus aquaticus DSM 21051 TaxID=1423725 RepID=A0A0R2CWV1_9LACO|nr:HAD-IA family hydrolase [Liquorilactobacillus aquaticus]KRM96383.1 phosphoglycolate phosphatase [Liquorilactobacillus aquaticus DSM 21051]
MTDYFWDFDGTLYDTYRGMVKSFVIACTESGFKVESDQVYKSMRRTSLHQTFAIFLKNVDFKKKQRIVTRYETVEKSEQTNDRPFKGAAEVCKWVIEQNGRNFLVTHRNKSALNMLKRDQFTSLFTGCVTSENNFPRKPNPASLNFLCDQYQVDKDNSFMVGDRALDIEAAHKAGIKGILFDPDDIIFVETVPDKRIKSLLKIIV